MEAVTDFIFLGSKINGYTDCSHEIKRRLILERKAMVNLDSILKCRNITLLTKLCLVKPMIFPVVMYGCESWTIKKLSAKELVLLSCGVGEYSWESLGLQGDQSVNPKGDQSWMFIGRTDAEAPILWSPDGENRPIGKDPDAEKEWEKEKKGATEDEMVG